MVLLVPFDGSELSEAALRRASEFGEFVDERVVVLVVLPEDEAYARERDWVDPGEEYQPMLVAGRFEDRVEAIAPDAEFRVERTETTDPVATVTTDITRAIRQTAAELGASVVFVGSENAGRVSTPLTSVGSPITNDPEYDVHIVRHAD